MGAVTAMNYLAKKKKYTENIKVAVLDSPFINLHEVIS
jgi:alpha-beta hydrolase superfamily lysophospholipase